MVLQAQKRKWFATPLRHSKRRRLSGLRLIYWDYPILILPNALEVLTKAVLRQIEDYMDYVRKQPLFNSQYRRWKFIAVCSAVDDDVKARYDSQKSKGKKGLVAEIDNYEVYALTWDDVFQSFDLRHAFLLDKLKMDKEAIAAEIAQTAGDEKSKDTADALTALVAN